MYQFLSYLVFNWEEVAQKKENIVNLHEFYMNMLLKWEEIFVKDT